MGGKLVKTDGSEPDSLWTRLTPDALRGAAAKARQIAQLLPTDAATDKILTALSDRRTTRLVHAGLGIVGNVGLKTMFRAEPDARLLFDLADWCGEQAGRGPVMLVLLEDAMQPTGAFYLLSRTLPRLPIADPRMLWGGAAPSGGVLATLRDAQKGMLLTLSKLVATALEQPPPDPSAQIEDVASRLRSPEIPARFFRIADLAMGVEGAKEDASASDGSIPQEPTEARPQLLPVLARVRNLLPVKALPPGIRFMLGPYLVFLQAYLGRNLVDSLPRFLALVREQVDSLPVQPPTDTSAVLDMEE